MGTRDNMFVQPVVQHFPPNTEEKRNQSLDSDVICVALNLKKDWTYRRTCTFVMAKESNM
ncbi:hypothetical protein DPMN_171093 [Dreissena polymorpha]|uniref:Uncharacterized protein n=1 Tax=Dreissena polymorpha TaxID=45954 RepID=A0A9D4DYA7_DREPO|nr:hypothetical protein DPMN_171093 [Dreissena polymorpha]